MPEPPITSLEPKTAPDDQNCDSSLKIEYVDIPYVEICNISKNKQKEIEAAFKKAQRTAEQTYYETLKPAEDAKAAAESKYKTAEATYNSAIKILKIKIENLIEDARQVYEECKLDPSGKEVPPDQKAICATQLNEELSTQQVAFYTEKQPLEQTKATASAEWTTAQKTYELAKELADKEKELACKQAESKKYDDISKALQDYFD